MFKKIKNGALKILFVIKLLWQRFFEHKILATSAQAAYFFILAIFPFLIFINALIASFNIPSAAAISFLEPIFPEKVVSFIAQYLEYINTQSGGSILSFGIILTIFTSSTSVRSLIAAFNKAYETEQKRGFFAQVLFSMIFIILFAFMLLACITLVAFGNDFISKTIADMSVPLAFIDLFSVWRWVTMSALLFLIMMLIYKILPSVKLRFRDTLPGTLFALVGFLLLTAIFSFYVNHIVSTSLFYGSFGAVILVMFWMYFAGAILILGAELNKIISDLRK